MRLRRTLDRRRTPPRRVAVFGGALGILRFDPKTGLSEIYNVPLPGLGIRGGDIDKNGVVWASLTSGHLASFDRRKCKGPLNGPNDRQPLSGGLVVLQVSRSRL
jgi:streptogramin lyase